MKGALLKRQISLHLAFSSSVDVLPLRQVAGRDGVSCQVGTCFDFCKFLPPLVAARKRFPSWLVARLSSL